MSKILSAFSSIRYPLPLSIYSNNHRYPADTHGNPVFMLGYGNQDKAQSSVLDQLTGKINYLRIWNINHLQDASTLWDVDSAYKGADVYEWGRPWPTVGGKADFDQWNETYWTNLSNYLANMQARAIFVGILIWDAHFEIPGGRAGADSVWNSSLNVQGIQWAFDYDSLVAFPNPTKNGSSAETLIYYQRRWVDRLTALCRQFPNILIELNNEDSWDAEGTIPETWWLWWAQHFRDSGFLVAVNSGGHGEGALSDSTFAANSLVQMKSYHTRDAASIDATHIAYNKIIVADGDNDCADFAADTARHMAWRALCRGGHWVDFVCGGGTEPAYPNATKLNYYGFLLSFLSSRSVPFAQMHPDATLTNHGLCLVKTGTHYLVYPETTLTVTVDLNAVSGTLNYEWYNPLIGAQTSTSTVAGGASRDFTPPANTAVLWIYP